MCYRYFLKAGDLKAAAKKLGAALKKEFGTRYNIAPGVSVPGIRIAGEKGVPEVAELKWGLIPTWTKDPAVLGAKLANARAESLADKASFRDAFITRRCIIPASGFFEWQSDPQGNKLPWLFGRADGEPLLLAGLWESWRAPEGTITESCAIITTEPNDLIRAFHDRMPVLLAEENARTWMGACADARARLLSLLAPCPASLMTAQRVDSWVNSVKHDDERCIAPARDKEQLGLDLDT
ncbi:MAG: SOS response-associated peptidase [Opitutaceae bacterium]|jgi:putative SOS response-associated peptidase YedK